MPSPRETLFAPILEPGDPASLPDAPFASERMFVPMRPDRRGRPVGRAWLRAVAENRAIFGHTCVSDVTLRRLETLDPLGLRLAADLRLRGLLTPDVPLYGFMTGAQKDRARDHHLHRLVRCVEAGTRQGLEVVPLLKALDADALDTQLDLVQEIGLRRAALYAREFLLEHDLGLLRRFVRGAHRRGIRPLLLGALAPACLAWGPVELAARHPYVLARRGMLLDARGRRHRIAASRYSPHARRFLLPGDRRGLCTHNHIATGRRLERLAAKPLEV